MSVRSITMIDQTNTYPKDMYDEPRQGTVYNLIRIYKVENTDGEPQYFKFEIELDSYGNVGGNYTDVESSIPTKFTPVTVQTKSVTVFE